MSGRIAPWRFAAVFAAPVHAAPIHEYDLNGSFVDSLGGPSLVSGGRSLGASGYGFGVGVGQGEGGERLLRRG